MSLIDTDETILCEMMCAGVPKETALENFDKLKELFQEAYDERYNELMGAGLHHSSVVPEAAKQGCIAIKAWARDNLL